MNTNSLTTLLVECPDNVRSAIRSALPAGVDIQEATESEVAATHWAADVVLLGDGTADPVGLAQDAWRHNPHASVLINMAPEKRGGVARRLQCTPFIGRSTRCLATNDPTELARAVVDRLDMARARRGYVQTAASVATALAKVGAPAPDAKHSFRDLLARDRFRAAVVDCSSDAILATDLDGAVQTWNAAAERLYGYAGHEIVGKNAKTLLPPDRLAEFRGFLKAIRGGIPVSHRETVHRRKDGSDLRVILALSPLMGQRGQAFGASLVVRSLSDAQTGEGVPSRAHQELELFAHVVARYLERETGEVASHAQRVASAYETVFDEEGHQSMQHVLEGTERISMTVEDLAAYAHVWSEHSAPVPVSASDVIDRVLAVLAPRIDASAAQVEVGDLPDVMVDPPQFEQVFRKLLDNALRYRGPEPARVEVTAELRGREAIFCVRDHGVGMRPDREATVFEMFERLRAVEAPDDPGRGTGLVIVKRIVERHGGRVWFATGIERGTAVHFSLPLSPARDAAKGA